MTDDAERRVLADAVIAKVADTVNASRVADLAGDGGRVNLGLTTDEWEIVLTALRAPDAGLREAEERMRERCARAAFDAVTITDNSARSLAAEHALDLAAKAIRALPTTGDRNAG